MTTTLPAAQLDQIVDLVAHGNVVPIVGDDLLALDTARRAAPGHPGGCRAARRVIGALANARSDAVGCGRYLATGPRAKMQRVRAELGAIIKAEAATWQPATALCDLAAIDGFTLFLSTGLDPLLENGASARSWRGAGRRGIHGRFEGERLACPGRFIVILAAVAYFDSRCP